ncbi:MAG: hypothetical protein ONB24_00665 [candidate division KSB1 bacterium]|nr:hypothetical protein [candidate division KSB1 bacterium]MDZ7369587.1 hypothetical protein [candidate division KSB1 bacterium]
MKETFYDVKLRKSVQADVVEKVTYGEPGKQRYALKGKTSDGRSLTKFVSKETWDKVKV